ncbi:AraC family transcriptional regulator [Chryseobacterium sp. 1B4]
MSQTGIKEIAFQTGVSDTNYFTRIFKQLEGVTPKSYQDRMVMRSFSNNIKKSPIFGTLLKKYIKIKS